MVSLVFVKLCLIVFSGSVCSFVCDIMTSFIYFIYLTSNNCHIRTIGQVKCNNDEKTSSQI
jgi:hypothetical protein